MEKIINTQNNTEHQFRHIVELGEQPLHKREQHEKSDIATETFQFFREFFQSKNFKEHTNNSEAYAQLPNKKIITRREDPRKLFELFATDDGYSLDFEKDRYANCVEWNPHTDGSKNIHNAFMEGFTNLNGMVVVIGFSADENSDLASVPDAVQNFHGIDRRGVRSYKGKVTSDNLHFVTIRIPAHLLPESVLTDDEIDKLDEYTEKASADKQNPPVMIFRTFLPNKVVH